MRFDSTVRLALILLCVLLPNVTALGQTRRGAVAAQRPPLPTREAGASASTARREWDANRDWLRFTTGVLGDTTVKDDIKGLLASGVRPETQDRYGRTALHAAAMLGQVELARFLLSKGADINVRDREGRTPLMVSASVGGFDLRHQVAVGNVLDGASVRGGASRIPEGKRADAEGLVRHGRHAEADIAPATRLGG